MAKGEALGHTVNLEPWYTHHILCTHGYFLYQSTETVNVRRKITALTTLKTNWTPAPYTQQYITYIGVIYIGETTIA
jgi:hypothetical protein